MEEKILKDLRNNVLKRREMEILLVNRGNPGFIITKDLISHRLKVSRENIVMNHINGEFGRNEFVIDAFIYDSKEDLERIEGKQKVNLEKTDKTEETKK